jgi:O-glycosyl hydrolase
VKIRLVLLELLVLTVIDVHGEKNVSKYKIETEQPCQTIDCFGASDAWSMDKLGRWPKEQQNQIADWLFSCDNDNTGKPKGIGLSIWRFNLGAGSEEQGDSSKIQSSTRTECFLSADGSYNWNKQEGQRNFMKLAKERGVNHFLAFLNSPPVYFTQNGLATNTGRGASFNLKNDCYNDFARFISTVIKELYIHDSIKIDYISPVNEPDGSWNWLGPKQEGTPASNREIARLVKLISNQFVKDSVKTKILVDESSDYRCLMGIHNSDWQRGNAIRTFFSVDSTETYLGATPRVESVIAAHSYWTNTPLSMLHDMRCALRDSVKKYGIGFWETELCIMGNDEEIGGGGGYDFTMKTALYVARVIHHDLVMADASSWQWWRAAGGNYKDGLIRIFSSDDMKSGRAVTSKLLWSLGNYSRFIRPNAVRYTITAFDNKGRIVAEGDTDPEGIMCSAYRNVNGQWVVVAINYSSDSKSFRFGIDKVKNSNWKFYRTSDREDENILPIGIVKNSKVTLAPRSITTFVSEYH